MKIIVHQTIQIHYLKINSMSNASILQIGSAGSISSLSTEVPTDFGQSSTAQTEGEDTELLPGQEQ